MSEGLDSPQPCQSTRQDISLHVLYSGDLRFLNYSRVRGSRLIVASNWSYNALKDSDQDASIELKPNIRFSCGLRWVRHPKECAADQLRLPLFTTILTLANLTTRTGRCFLFSSSKYISGYGEPYPQSLINLLSGWRLLSAAKPASRVHHRQHAIHACSSRNFQPSSAHDQLR
jgi:hypothetical protein